MSYPLAAPPCGAHVPRLPHRDGHGASKKETSGPPNRQTACDIPTIWVQPGNCHSPLAAAAPPWGAQVPHLPHLDEHGVVHRLGHPHNLGADGHMSCPLAASPWGSQLPRLPHRDNMVLLK
eukprot:6668167-Pyramimonas_sp.AAC.1